MSILIGGINKNNPPVMRALMMDSSEKYRLIIGDKYRGSILVYAKGWINFDPNPIKDGSNNDIDYSGILTNGDYWANIYAFYDDGFYTYDNGNWTYKGNSLSTLNRLTSIAATFNGWYTQRTGGYKVDSIDDVYRHTNLFSHKTTTTIPEITLYAHWEIKKVTVYVNNITRYNSSNENQRATSSFIYNGYRTMMRTTLQVPYNTELISYLRGRITSPQYNTWARFKLDGTNLQQGLREFSPGFLGWYTSGDGNGTTWATYYVTNTTNIYPQFKALVIWPRVNFPPVTVGNTRYTGGSSACGYASFDLPTSKGNAIYQWETTWGHTASNEIPDPWGGYRKYDDAGFPLGSAHTAIVGLYYYV